LRLKAIIELKSGQAFEGVAVCGREGAFTGEVVFNTSMTGTTEIITDPASMGQILVLTYPMIGNSGISFDDFQSDKPQIAALVISELSGIESNFRSKDSLKAVLERLDIPIITGVDTRSLVRLLRKCDSGGQGPQQASVLTGGNEQDASPLSCKPFYTAVRRAVKADKPIATLAVLDTGLRRDLESMFTSLNISLEIFPYGEAGDFDGYILPGGPGNPEDYDINPVKEILRTNKPIFAAGLGHQLLAMANGAKIIPLCPGHRGANIPVYSKKTNLSSITLQNHGYAVDAGSVDKDKISHVNINDGTVEGICWRENIISVQFQPDIEIIKEFADIVKGK
jgi:carbamoyl-phosphate synthase small subunit